MGRMSLMGLIVLVAGCSKGVEDPVAPGGNETEQGLKAIAFSTDLPEQQEITRSTPLEEELPVGQKTFKVWGFKNDAYDSGTSSYTSYQTVFPGYFVNWVANTAATTASNTHDWEYVGQQGTGDPAQTIKYWDFSAKAYRFFAATKWQGESAGPYVAEKSYGANGTYGPEGAYRTYEISMLADATDDDKIEATPYFSRLWFSDNTEKPYGQPVTLEFVKPYSKVRFLFIYSYPPEGIKLKNKKFRPTFDVTADEEDKVKIPTAGTFTVIYPLTGPETRETFSVTGVSSRLDEFTEDYIAEGSKKWYTVLPNNTQGSYTLSVNFNNDLEPKTAVVPANYMTWLPGYSYTYVFKITDEGGVEIELVQSAVTTWVEDPDPLSHIVYNW